MAILWSERAIAWRALPSSTAFFRSRSGTFRRMRSSRTYTFAHRLRIKLWAHHLNMDNKQGWAELADGVASVDAWKGGAGKEELRGTKFYNYVHETDKKEYWLENAGIDPRGNM